MNTQNQMDIIYKKGNITVELHTQITPSGRLSVGSSQPSASVRLRAILYVDSQQISSAYFWCDEKERPKYPFKGTVESFVRSRLKSHIKSLEYKVQDLNRLAEKKHKLEDALELVGGVKKATTVRKAS